MEYFQEIMKCHVKRKKNACFFCVGVFIYAYGNKDFHTLCFLFVCFVCCVGSAHCYSEYVDCILEFDDDLGFANLFSTYQPGVPDG